MKKDKKGRVVIPDNFDLIKQEELKTGDIVLFLYGNKLTEWHGRNRRKKLGRSTLPPYHAAIVLGTCRGIPIILDPEITTSLSPLKEYTRKKEVRIDIVRFEATEAQRQAIADKIIEVSSKEGFYDWKGYGAFVSQMPGMSWAKIVKPSKENFYCSDASVYCVQQATNIRVSPRGHDYTAPVDIQLYGIRNHKLYTVKKKGEII